MTPPSGANAGNPAAINAMSPGDIRSGVAAAGHHAATSGNNMPMRLQNTKDQIADAAAKGQPMTAGDILNPRNTSFNGRKILSVAALIGAAGIAVDRGQPDSGDTPATGGQPASPQGTGSQSHRALSAVASPSPSTSSSSAPQSRIPKGYSEVTLNGQLRRHDGTYGPARTGRNSRQIRGGNRRS